MKHSYRIIANTGFTDYFKKEDIELMLQLGMIEYYTSKIYKEETINVYYASNLRKDKLDVLRGEYKL